MPKKSRASDLRVWLGQKNACELLESEGGGLYEEIDKLCKKVPSETATTLQVNVTNSFIKRVKQLLSDDPIINEVNLFVPAGDNPEYRDLLTVLRQIKQSLMRYRKQNPYLWDEEFEEELAEHNIDDDDATQVWN